MANDNKQNRIIGMLPDKPIFRKLASAMKIRIAYRYAIGEKEIHAGENKAQEKTRIVKKYCKKWERAAKKQKDLIDELFNEIPYYSRPGVDLKKIREDILFCFFAYGFTPTEYFSFRLAEKNENERKNFVSSRLRMKYRCKMNDILQAYKFNDKTETYKLFKKYYQRDAIAIESPQDFRKFQEFVRRHPIFVKKQVYEAQGNSVELINIQKCGKNAKELFGCLIENGKHILEERIIQSKDLAAFNESSVNTVRCITFNTKSGIRSPYCTIRTGRPGAFVDNGGAGGIQACVDFSTGKIITDGFDEIGGIFTEHPASGTKFKGYQLPDWKQLQNLVKEAASYVPLIKFIGWDLAHTSKGWVIVEGNENCYIIAKQMIDDKGIKDEFDTLMQDMELII